MGTGDEGSWEQFSEDLEGEPELKYGPLSSNSAPPLGSEASHVTLNGFTPS